MILLTSLLISSIFKVEGLEPLKVTTDDEVFVEQGTKLQLTCFINRPFLNVTIEWRSGTNLQNSSLIVQSHYGVVGGPHFKRGFDLLKNSSLLIEQYTESLQGTYYCKARDLLGEEAFNSTNLVTYVQPMEPRLLINFCEDVDQNCTKNIRENSTLDLLCWTSSNGPAIYLTWKSNLTSSFEEFNYSSESINGTTISKASLTVRVIYDVQYICTAYSDDFHVVNSTSSFINISPVKEYPIVLNHTADPVTPHETGTACAFSPLVWPFVVTSIMCVAVLGLTIALLVTRARLKRINQTGYHPARIFQQPAETNVDTSFDSFDVDPEYISSTCYNFRDRNRENSDQGYEDPYRSIENSDQGYEDPHQNIGSQRTKVDNGSAVTVEVKTGSNLILPCTNVDGVVWKFSNNTTEKRLVCIDSGRYLLGTEDFHTIEGNLFINGFTEKHEGIYYTGDLESLKSDVDMAIFYVYCGESPDITFRSRPGSTVYLPFNEYDKEKTGSWIKWDKSLTISSHIINDDLRFKQLENGNLVINNVTEEDSAKYTSSFSQYECTSTYALSVEP